VAAAPAVLIHAGAGPLGTDLRDHSAEVRRVLLDVLVDARELLEQGATALEATVACVVALEDCELFNAGLGSALCSDGTVQMSAAAMRGSDRAAGAVAGVRTVRNPINTAELVLGSPEVLIIGEHADRLALDHGLPTLPNEAFITKRERVRLALRSDVARGTVGAVCLDYLGTLAAATSTGGISGQVPGRVGDSPVIGAGTWADDRVAVSCTGDGEAFIRAAAASRIASLVAHGHPLAEAAARTLADVGQLGGRGGLIALGADGDHALELSTEAMPRGLWRAGAEPAVWIAR
jgi:beta-aspartyl-peptidase (threonine type)